MASFDPYDCLVPVYVSTDAPRRLQQLGTAVFVESQSDLFLYTAAHITDELKHGTLLVPTSDGLSPIEGYLGYIDLLPEDTRGDDNIDIAYYRLAEAFVQRLTHHFTPISAAYRELIPSALELTTCSASGFPVTKSKKNGDVLTSEIFSFGGVAASEGTYEALALSPTSNIVLHFNRKTAVHPENGKPFPTTSLRGISGGGIFAWPREATGMPPWSSRKLVGIAHTYKEREGLIIGTSILPLLSAISLGRMKNFRGVR
jgi:hypothetical protein